MALIAALAIASVMLVACGGGNTGGTANPTVSPPVSSSRPITYANPFAYCDATGSVDYPGAAYAGPQYPQSVLDALAAAAGVPSVSGVAPWRCVDGAVWACTVGANLPCGKITTSMTPTQAMDDYCASNEGAANIPAVVTGHDTAYAWSCDGARAVAGRQVITVDERGFAKEFWYLLAPPRDD